MRLSVSDHLSILTWTKMTSTIIVVDKKLNQSKIQIKAAKMMMMMMRKMMRKLRRTQMRLYILICLTLIKYDNIVSLKSILNFFLQLKITL